MCINVAGPMEIIIAMTMTMIIIVIIIKATMHGMVELNEKNWTITW